MIRVVAHVTSVQGRADALRAVLVDLLEPTRAEDGCVFYDIHQGENPLVYTFIEEWASEQHLTSHLRSPHMARAMGALDGLVACAPDIQQYRPLPGTEKA